MAERDVETIIDGEKLRRQQRLGEYFGCCQSGMELVAEAKGECREALVSSLGVLSDALKKNGWTGNRILSGIDVSVGADGVQRMKPAIVTADGKEWVLDDDSQVRDYSRPPVKVFAEAGCFVLKNEVIVLMEDVGRGSSPNFVSRGLNGFVKRNSYFDMEGSAQEESQVGSFVDEVFKGDRTVYGAILPTDKNDDDFAEEQATMRYYEEVRVVKAMTILVKNGSESVANRLGGQENGKLNHGF